jgi:hypothetical protein
VIVQRVVDGRSSWIEPPLDESWPDLERLRWHAAVVCLDAGAPPGTVEVEEARLWVGGDAVPDVYNVRRAGASIGVFTFGRAWDYLNGWSDGFRAGVDA